MKLQPRPATRLYGIWKFMLCGFYLIFALINQDLSAQENPFSKMTLYTAKNFQASFLVPKAFNIDDQEDRVGFKSADGSAVIRFQPVLKKAYGGEYTDALEMADYLSSEMTSRMGAKVEPVQQKNISGRKGYQLFMDWKIDGQPIRQCETILDENKQLITFTFIATPESYKTYWPLYRETIHSYRSLKGDTAVEDVQSKPQDQYFEIKPDGSTLDILLGKDPVRVLFKTGGTGNYVVKSQNINQASALLLLYNKDGKKITDNVTDEKKLTAGFRVKLKADSVYMVLVAPAWDSQHGKTSRIVVIKEQEKATEPKAAGKAPSRDAGDVPTAPAEAETAKPFKDESALMVAVELDPTPEKVRQLAAVRAARARDLFEFAEAHKDGAAFDLALIYAESARELDPDQPAYTFLVGILYAKAAHLPLAPSLAEAALLQVLDEHPEHLDARAVLGDLYYRQSRFEDAIETFETLFMTDFTVNPQAVTMLTTAYAAADRTNRGRRFIADCTIKKGASPYLNLAGAVLARHESDTATAMVYLNQVINDPAAHEAYRLYASQLKTIWTKEAE